MKPFSRKANNFSYIKFEFLFASFLENSFDITFQGALSWSSCVAAGMTIITINSHQTLSLSAATNLR